MDKEQARQLLKSKSLRVTSQRLAVVRVLADAGTPLSCGQVLSRLGETDWDDATIYRNLVKLRDSGLASVVGKVEGIDRYVLTTKHSENHRHPHFLCEKCGRVACLPNDVALSGGENDRWSASIRKAVLQLKGECPDCIA